MEGFLAAYTPQDNVSQIHQVTADVAKKLNGLTMADALCVLMLVEDLLKRTHILDTESELFRSYCKSSFGVS